MLRPALVTTVPITPFILDSVSIACPALVSANLASASSIAAAASANFVDIIDAPP